MVIQLPRYDNRIIETTPQGKPYIKGKQYPNTPLSASDIYVITTVGDRLDLLAYNYYRDVNLWWIISAANTNDLAKQYILQGGILNNENARAGIGNFSNAYSNVGSDGTLYRLGIRPKIGRAHV